LLQHFKSSYETTRENLQQHNRECLTKKTRSLVAPSKNLQLQHRKTLVYLDLNLDQTNQQQAEKSHCNKTNLMLGHIGIIAATSKKIHLKQKHIKIRLLCGATSRVSQCNGSKKINAT